MLLLQYILPQETRRIMAACWQVIIYREYLPLVLGPEYMRRHGLILERTGYWDGNTHSLAVMPSILIIVMCAKRHEIFPSVKKHASKY